MVAGHADQRSSVTEQRLGFASSSLTPDAFTSFVTGCFERPGSNEWAEPPACAA